MFNLLIQALIATGPALSVQAPQNNPPSPIQMAEGTYNSISYVMFSLDPLQVTFEVVSPKEKEAAMQTRNVLIINGGFFREDGTPCGLLVSNGRSIHAKSNASLLSGIFMLRQGQASIIESSSFREDPSISFALQNGPRLVEHGQNEIKSNQTPASRTIIATDKSGRVYIIIIKSEAGLLECADLLIKTIKNIDMALNLDGGPATYSYYSWEGQTASFGCCPQYPAYFIKISPTRP